MSQVTTEDVIAVIERQIDDGVTDGLPVIPPTRRRVEAAVAASGRGADVVIGIIPPQYQEVSVQDIAVNAVMAGAKPEYLPIIITALEAMLEPDFHLEHLGTSTKGNAPMVIVNGPIAGQVGMNSGAGLLGPGNRANATIGRTIRLVMMNLGGSQPGVLDRAQFGHGGKYSYAFAEDEEHSPWPPCAADAGFSPETNAVTVVNAEAPRIFGAVTSDPDELVARIVDALSVVPSDGDSHTTEAVVLLAPDHRGIFAEAGWSKRDVQLALWERTTRRVEQIARHDGPKDADGKPLPGHAEIRLFKEPEHLRIVAAGGPGICGMVILAAPWLDYGRIITREIHGPGTEAVEDLTARLDDVLGPVSEELGADGYRLQASVEGGVLHAAVVAGDGACEDCLVPKEIFAAVLTDRLQAAGVAVSDVSLRYPTDTIT